MLSKLPCLSSIPLKSGVKFISRSVCLSEKGPRNCESLKNYHFTRSLVGHIIDVSEIWKMPCTCHLKVTSKCTWYLLSHLLFLIVILFMSFPSLGILCRFKSHRMKHNPSGERHVPVKYGPECHHPSDVCENRDGECRWGMRLCALHSWIIPVTTVIELFSMFSIISSERIPCWSLGVHHWHTGHDHLKGERKANKAWETIK